MMDAILVVIVGVLAALPITPASTVNFPGLAKAQTTSCGKPAIQAFFPSVVGGSKAVKGSWPWMANLRMPYILNPTGYMQFCGGTLINNQWVITAAHCASWISDKELPRWRMGLGFYQENGIGDDMESDLYGFSGIFVHEDYNYYTLENDIALVKLNRRVIFSDYVSPACLPSRPIQCRAECTGTPVVTGWGETEGTAPKPDYLQQAQVPYIATATCNQPDWYDGNVYDGMFCAGYAQGGIDTCQGDSGGPVVCMGRDRKYYVHGITSWGYGCAEPHSPGVYTRVNFFRDWIDEKIANN